MEKPSFYQLSCGHCPMIFSQYSSNIYPNKITQFCRFLCTSTLKLVGGLEHEWIMTFHSVGNVIIPTDFHSIIFQRGRYTSNQINIFYGFLWLENGNRWIYQHIPAFTRIFQHLPAFTLKITQFCRFLSTTKIGSVLVARFSASR